MEIPNFESAVRSFSAFVERAQLSSNLVWVFRNDLFAGPTGGMMMDMNLLTIQDIPVLLAALKSEDFVTVLDNYFSTIDINARRRNLASDPLYARFCGGKNDV
jgi:hypothetical protein